MTIKKIGVLTEYKHHGLASKVNDGSADLWRMVNYEGDVRNIHEELDGKDLNFAGKIHILRSSLNYNTNMGFRGLHCFTMLSVAMC